MLKAIKWFNAVSFDFEISTSSFDMESIFCIFNSISILLFSRLARFSWLCSDFSNISALPSNRFSLIAESSSVEALSVCAVLTKIWLASLSFPDISLIFCKSWSTLSVFFSNWSFFAFSKKRLIKSISTITPIRLRAIQIARRTVSDQKCDAAGLAEGFAKKNTSSETSSVMQHVIMYFISRKNAIKIKK